MLRQIVFATEFEVRFRLSLKTLKTNAHNALVIQTVLCEQIINRSISEEALGRPAAVDPETATSLIKPMNLRSLAARFAVAIFEL